MDSSSKKYVLLISAGGSFLAPFMVSALIVAIPAIGKDFSMDAAAMSRLATAFFLAASMFLLPFGRMADIYGVKRIFTAGLYVYFVSAALAALAPSALAIMTARFLTGIGAAMVFGTSFALLSLSLPISERGKALGTNIAASLVGFALGFQAGGLLTYYFSWRAIFLLILPIPLAVIALIRTKLPGECALSKGQRLDLQGAVMVALTIFFIVAGLSELPKLLGLLLLISGLAAFILFVFWETHTLSPLIDLRIFSKNRTFVLANAAVLIYNSGTFAAIFLFSLYLQYIQELDARVTGLILLTATLIMAVLVGVAGRLSDRYRPYLIASAGIFITLVGILAMTFISSITPLELVLAEFLMLIVGGALFPSPMVKIVLGCIPREMYGVGSSLEETMRLLGNAVSMAITTVAFNIYLRGANITPELYPAFLESLSAIFGFFFILTLLSFILVVMAGRRRSRRVTKQ
jgi:MFS family permease